VDLLVRALVLVRALMRALVLVAFV